MVDFEMAIRALYSGNEAVAAQHFLAHLATHPSDSLAQWYSTHLTKVATALLDKELGFLVPYSIIS